MNGVPRNVLASEDMGAGTRVVVSWDNFLRCWVAWEPEPDRPNLGYFGWVLEDVDAWKRARIRYDEEV